MEVFPNDGMGLPGGVGQIANRLIFQGLIGGKGEGYRGLVPRLKLHLGKIHAAAVHPGGRARLEPAEGDPQLSQALRQGRRGGQTVGAAVPCDLPHDGAPGEIGARADDGGPHLIDRTVDGADSGDRPVFRQDVGDLRLLHP